MADGEDTRGVESPAEDMGEATNNRYNPAYNHLVSLRDECQQNQAPEYVLNGISKALKLIEARDLYCENMTSEPSDALTAVAAETRSHPWTQLYEEGKTKWNQSPVMLSGKLEGKFLQSVVSMQKAKRVLEIGMYTGYSALASAEALPEDGEVVTCDADPYLEEFAKRSFSRSPHGKKIRIRLGDAKDTLKQLIEEKQSFDVVFIDADKPSYKEYYQTIMDNGLLNKGGTILLDNAMFYGQAYAEDCTQDKMPHGWGVRKCNEFIVADTRVERVLVPIRDGVLIVRRKEEMTS